MAIPKILMCLAILACAATVQSKPTSDLDKASCVGCNPVEILTRAKRGAEDIIRSVSGLIENILHENWSHIERISAMQHGSRNVFIGNGHDNYNRVTIHSKPDDNYY